MPDPIVKTIEVPCSQEQAFNVFVNEISNWWPLGRYSLSARCGEVSKSLHIEPKQGGKIVEIAYDDAEHLWGTVKTYDPHESLSMVWHPGDSAKSASLVELQFAVLEPERTRVRLTESNWEAHRKTAKMRHGRHGDGWIVIFEQAFKSACDGGPPVSRS